MHFSVFGVWGYGRAAKLPDLFVFRMMEWKIKIGIEREDDWT